jgi:hypothetical protein
MWKCQYEIVITHRGWKSGKVKFRQHKPHQHKSHCDWSQDGHNGVTAWRFPVTEWSQCDLGRRNITIWSQCDHPWSQDRQCDRPRSQYDHSVTMVAETSQYGHSVTILGHKIVTVWLWSQRRHRHSVTIQGHNMVTVRLRSQGYNMVTEWPSPVLNNNYRPTLARYRLPLATIGIGLNWYGGIHWWTRQRSPNELG